MKTPARLAVYGGALVLVFAGAAAAGRAVVPESTVAAWTKTAKEAEVSHTEHSEEPKTTATNGVAMAQDGYVLSPVTAPDRIGTRGRLAFRIYGPDGAPLTRYQESHEKQLHLIVVRSDGTGFRHVHPTLDGEGVWSLPWRWDAAGSYRVYADFVPDVDNPPDLTLSRTVEVAGHFTPAPPTTMSRTATVDGFEVTLDGDLPVGGDTALTATVRRDGRPVTALQPYLGAFGHLVVLRHGDLAYLHVHPMGEEPGPGATSGPTIDFMSSAPTAGRYLLYLDFKVDDRVHTARFVLDAGTTPAAGPGTTSKPTPTATPAPRADDTSADKSAGDKSPDKNSTDDHGSDDHDHSR